MKKHLLIDQIPGDVKLHDFVGERSWLIFHLMNIEVDWMQCPPYEWHKYPSYIHFKKLVDSLQVVNDCAERAIKDMTEYLNYSRDAERC